MKTHRNWQLMLGILLVLASAAVYGMHFLIFHDFHHIMIYLIGDIAFVFLEVLLVTLIIHRLLLIREKQALFKKLNMVIGAFFSEVGNSLLKVLIPFDASAERCRDMLAIPRDISARGFEEAARCVQSYDSSIDGGKGNLEALKTFLDQKRSFVLGLLENPNLLEHESFTNMLWAVFHLAEELSFRQQLSELPDTDIQHLSGDIKRAYHLLVSEWLAYMKHLKGDYPYLFSLALRTNPFDSGSSVIVR